MVLDLALVVGDDPLGDPREAFDVDLHAGLLAHLARDRFTKRLAPFDPAAR